MSSPLVKWGDGPWQLTIQMSTYSYQVPLTPDQEVFLGLRPMYAWDGISRHWAEEAQEQIKKEFDIRVRALQLALSTMPRAGYGGANYSLYGSSEVRY